MNVVENKDKWIEKYRPQTIDDMVLAENIKTYFNDMAKTKKFINFTLSGSPGFGKTTLALALAKISNAEVLFLNCAAGDGKVEAIQTKIIPFAQSVPFDDKPLFVILDELDSASATQDSSFQKSLRNVIEGYPNVVYIGTCNYSTKIIPAILSRCPEIKLSFNTKDLLFRVKDILDNEHISYTIDDLKKFVSVIIKKYYPDIRSIINHLQYSCSSGKLVVDDVVVNTSTKQTEFIDTLLDKIKNEKSLFAIRQFYLQIKDSIDDFKVLGSNLFNLVLDKNLISDNTDILNLADIYYKLNIVIDPEIQFFAMITLIHKALH